MVTMFHYYLAMRTYILCALIVWIVVLLVTIVTALLLNESKELPNNCPHDVIVSNLNELLELLKRPFDCVR